MSQSDGPFDAIVIGAGMSGLAAGIRLAMYDRRVLILERHYLWGGLNSFYKRRGRLHDVGLHALTNFAPKGRRGVPLTKLLRQLRLRHADLALGEQSFSEIAFPTERLRFSNEFELLMSEIERAFPGQVDGFRALTAEVMGYDSFSPPDPAQLARPVLERHLSEPLLVEMLMLPMCYYGSAIPGDIAWYQFAILFKSFFDEGFARPAGGIRPLLDLLVKRYRELGGELRMKTGVAEILEEGGRAVGVRTDSGEELRAGQVYSSAGYAPTLGLCGRGDEVEPDDRGRLSFNETVIVTDRPPLEYPGQADAPGAGAAIVFFNDSDTFHYRPPTEDGPPRTWPIDTRSGVICSPNHYAAADPLTEGVMRFTALSDPSFWDAFDDEAAYAAAKRASSEALLDSAARFAPDPRPFEVDRDAFTPRTITHFTGHPLGAVYGAPNKRLDGRTPVEELFLIGTDQGLLGVVGAMLSGISMANRHGLMSQASS
ncbi:MAG: NAD(P)/FAD-dependent oxidoreductase [Planctomycetota bacterium]|nr:NAD(P)/FAD-dependent oxidoreductase [Planctomycetota bacterium]